GPGRGAAAPGGGPAGQGAPGGAGTGAPVEGGFGGGPGGGRAGGGGGMGGLLGGTRTSAAATAALRADADRYTWAAAAVGAQNAASYQLASGEPVMPIGGFNGSDPSPTLAQFQAYVKAGKIHYFIGQGTEEGTGAGAGGRAVTRGGGGPGGGASSAIETWVKANYRSTTVGGATFYDLTPS
ncbi:glycosyl transferase, partial [Streptomyces sp. NPDC059917]